MENKYSFSYQPFWQAEKKGEALCRVEDAAMPVQAVLLGMKECKDGLDCIPGNGQFGVNFSLHEKEASAYAFGVLTEKKKLTMYGVENSLMLRFFPGQFTRITGIPADEIPPEGVPLLDLFPAASSVVEAMNESETGEERERLIQEFFRLCRVRKKRHSEYEEETVSAMVRYMMKEKRIVRLEELEDQLGYSARMIRKITARNVGISPKQMNMQICMQEAVCRLEQRSGRSVTELCHNLGFYDQSHFDKTFRRMTGLTPREFGKKAGM